MSFLLRSSYSEQFGLFQKQRKEFVENNCFYLKINCPVSIAYRLLFTQINMLLIGLSNQNKIARAYRVRL